MSNEAKETLKKEVDAGKFSVKVKSYEDHAYDLSVKNICNMGTKSLAAQLESKRVPDAFKKLCKAELDKRVAARVKEAKAEAPKAKAKAEVTLD
jgi:hypothetical protein